MRAMEICSLYLSYLSLKNICDDSNACFWGAIELCIRDCVLIKFSEPGNKQESG